MRRMIALMGTLSLLSAQPAGAQASREPAAAILSAIMTYADSVLSRTMEHRPGSKPLRIHPEMCRSIPRAQEAVCGPERTWPAAVAALERTALEVAAAHSGGGQPWVLQSRALVAPMPPETRRRPEECRPAVQVEVAPFRQGSDTTTVLASFRFQPELDGCAPISSWQLVELTVVSNGADARVVKSTWVYFVGK